MLYLKESESESEREKIKEREIEITCIKLGIYSIVINICNYN